MKPLWNPPVEETVLTKYINFLKEKNLCEFTDYERLHQWIINNKDFFIGYSPERVNPGDKINTLKNISKIVSIKTKNKKILKRIFKIYNQISKKIIRSSNIRAAETAK